MIVLEYMSWFVIFKGIELMNKVWLDLSVLSFTYIKGGFINLIH